MPHRWPSALVAAVAVIAMTGCGAVGGWVKPGVGAQEQRRDEEQCNSQAIAAVGRGPDARLLYQRCMQAKGYEPGEK